MDAGPLIALIDVDEPDHEACLEVLDTARLPLVTTWPAFTEAMYLLVRGGGDAARRAIWQLVASGRLVLAELSAESVERCDRLMEQYRDRPIDLADATLVALAEQDGHHVIFSLDSDFHVYRMRGNRRFVVLPAT